MYTNQQKLHSLFLGVLCLVCGLFSACGSSELALINQVKHFEPQWMTMGEQVGDLQLKLAVTEKRYPQDLESVNKKINQYSKQKVYDLRAQYKRAMSEREQIHARFGREYVNFESQVMDFNEWQSRLMKGKLKDEEARQQFQQFLQQQKDLQSAFETLDAELVTNIEAHNDVLRKMVKELDTYENYTIDPR